MELNYYSKIIKIKSLNSFKYDFHKFLIEYKMEVIYDKENDNCINFINSNNLKVPQINNIQLGEFIDDIHNDKNRLITQFLNKKKKMIFITNGRKHTPNFQKQNNKIHNRNYKDNILKKIQIYYWNFLVSFINEIIKKVLLEECYITKDISKILNMNKYLFNKIDYAFKSNIKRENMNFAESIKIRDLISPSVEFCKKYNIKNTNLKIMNNINLINSLIINKILNSQYLSYFNLYYKSERNIKIEDEGFQINLDLDKRVLLFDDLIAKYKNDEKYTSNIHKFAQLSFLKNKKKEKK